MLRMILACLLATTVAAAAQTAPSPAEIAAYRGLQRAAQDGDAAEVRRLAASGADLEQRDGHGRAPVHIAAFASNDAVLRVLAEAGADRTRWTVRPTTP
jgi:ankyrin repeat protein